jgi:hypothetical protein
MPYDPEPEHAYRSIVRPTIDGHGFDPVRGDRTPDGGPIYDSFIRSLESCACVIADISSEVNPNVMYEIGHAHARGFRPFLFSRSTAPSAQSLPFYLSTHRVGLLDDLGPFLAQVRAAATRGR